MRIAHKRLLVILRTMFFAVLLGAAPRAAAAPPVRLPPVNLGASSFMDAVGGRGGILVHESVGVSDSRRFAGSAGQTLPGNNSLAVVAAVTHFALGLPQEVLGGHWGAEVLLPVVHVHIVNGAGDASTDGLGDLIVSPVVLQAPHVRVFDRPLFQRLDFDLVLPTGKYRKDEAISIGNNVFSFNPYYALTLLLTERLETSWRIHYLWSSVNSSPQAAYRAMSIQPGQAVHVNAALSYALWPALRIGVTGYYLKQMTNHEIDGRPIAGSKEQVAGVGPGLSISFGSFWANVATYWEFAVKNRPVGEHLRVNIFYAWPL